MTKTSEARARNWRIFRLRGFWQTAAMLDGDLCDRVRAAVDEQLVRLGALSTKVQRERMLEELRR